MNKVLIAALVFFSQATFAKTYISEGMKFTVETMFEGKDVIWGFDFLDPKTAAELLFTERDGKIRLLDLNTKKTTEVSGAPKVYASSQGGLLDLLIDHKTSEIYLTYADPDPAGATTSLFRGKLSADKKKIEGNRLFQAQAKSTGSEHFGSRVVIDKDGFIFMSVGERNKRDRAQDLGSHQGKILRLNKEGMAPADNPFVKTKDALPEISIGTTEKSGLEQPLYKWVPSISPSGIMIYRGAAFPKFEGNLFLATLAGSHIHRVVTDKNRKIIKEEKLLDDLGERFRQVKSGPDGLIYISTDSGKILRLKPVQ